MLQPSVLTWNIPGTVVGAAVGTVDAAACVGTAPRALQEQTVVVSHGPGFLTATLQELHSAAQQTGFPRTTVAPVRLRRHCGPVLQAWPGTRVGGLLGTRKGGPPCERPGG